MEEQVRERQKQGLEAGNETYGLGGCEESSVVGGVGLCKWLWNGGHTDHVES